MSSGKFDYRAICELAAASGRSRGNLIALTKTNDPFFLTESRMRDARWFANLYREQGFGRGVHLRRIHYRLVSQETPVLLPNGKPYENVLVCWDALCGAATSARYAGLIPIRDFVDRRNPNPTIWLDRMPDGAPGFETMDGDHYGWTIEELAAPGPPSAYFPPLAVEGGGHAPGELDLPTLGCVHADAPVQPFHIELWCEKTTVADVLDSIAWRRKLNVVYGMGELSITACQQLIFDRVAANGGRPVRILYLSDFDPAGQSMPVAIARKIEFLIREAGLDVDLQVRPILLSHDQCIEYSLPRTPIKESEHRGPRFEARFGEGATELDALEALHEGELRRIVEREIDRYYLGQDELNELAQGIEEDTNAKLAEATEEVHAEHAGEIDAINTAFDALVEAAGAARARANEALEPFAAERERIMRRLARVMRDAEALHRRIEAAVAPIVDQYRTDVLVPLYALRECVEPILAGIAEDLRARGEEIVSNMDLIAPDGDEDPDPLYDSSRGYIEQIDYYKRHQGKRRDGDEALKQ